MISRALLMLVFITVILFADRHELLRKPFSRVHWVYLFLLAVSGYFSLEFIGHWKLPNIHDLAEQVFSRHANKLVKLLKS